MSQEHNAPMLRTLFAIVSGVFAMMIVITFVQLANIKLFFPPPAGIDWENPAAVAAFASSLPTAAMAVVVSGWLLGSFIGAAVAARIAVRYQLTSALLIGALVVAGVIHSAMSIAHPTWVIVAGVLLPLPLAYLAAKLVQKGFASTT